MLEFSWAFVCVYLAYVLRALGKQGKSVQVEIAQTFCIKIIRILRYNYKNLTGIML